MSLGSWDPNVQASSDALTLENAGLAKLINYSKAEQLDALSTLIPTDESQRLSGLMHIDHGEWQSFAGSLEADEIRHLIRFLAVAESLPGWEAGEHSPVIPLARELRQRGQKLDKEFLLWLRQVSENRFLPYGPL